MLAPGTRLAGYEVLAKLGEGGMGEVYRATDTRLGRAVAIKVLPDTFAADAERVPRFEREAKVLASLNHPHIAALYGMESSEGRQFLVMELVEGDTLADRLRGGPLSASDALDVAIQVADALDAAHEQGVVHRDLKPANVKITPAGKVKVLDFGIAKAAEPASSASNVTHSPTLSILATQAGMIMGTAAYMSPEQAKGLPVDRRSDVFSFGVVLYEMLTGRQPFRGDTAAEIMASVMIRDADLAALPASLPPRLREIVVRCLDKQPRKRWQSLGDLRVELEALRDAPPASTAPAAAPAAARPPLWKRALSIAAAMVLTAVATAFVVQRSHPTPPSPTVVRLAIHAADMRLTLDTLAVAPNGTAIAYAAASAGGLQLMVRRLNEFDANPIEAARGAFIVSTTFSPDGESLAFFADGQIRRVDLRGGPAVTICEASQNVRGLSWRGSAILFAMGNAIYRVADTGGQPERLVQFEPDQLASRPQVLDDDGTLLYSFAPRSDPPAWQVVMQTPSGSRTVLADNAVNPYYVAPGRVVFVRDGTLVAVPVDLRTGQATGREVPLIEGILRLLTTATTFHAAVSADGAVAYVPDTAGGKRKRLGFVQLDGQVEALSMPPRYYGHPRLSPDGRQLAVESDDGKDAAVWVGPVAGSVPLRRLTFDGRNVTPIWTRDGRYVAFQSDRDGDRGVFLQLADGSAPAMRLTKADPETQHFPESWSPDDRLLAVRVMKGRINSIWIAPRDGGALKPVIQLKDAAAMASAFSPDGRWLAYASNEFTGYNVFVQPYPPTGVKYQLTTRNTSTPVWSADGKQLYYAYTNRVSRAEVQTSGGMSLGPPTEFETAGSLPSTPVTRHFDVTPDGRRFLVVLPESFDATQRTSINVVLNWATELNAKLSQ